MDQPHLAQSAPACLPEVLVNHGGNVARGEGVEIEGVLDGENHRLAIRVSDVGCQITVGAIRLAIRHPTPDIPHLEDGAGQEMLLPVLEAQEILS
jgi:hypothetical protein